MKDWGTYRKLYETLPPDFERLPYAARCFAADILRRCDRVGRIVPGKELNEKLVADVAFHVRAHTGEEEFLLHALGWLLKDTYLVFSSGYLTVRNFIDAQRSDSALRMAKLRARTDDVEEPSDITEEDPGTAGTEEPLEPSDAGANSDAGDAKANPSFHLVSSGFVSSGSSSGSGSSPEKPKTRNKSSGNRTREVQTPAVLTGDWTPNDSQVAALATKYGVSSARLLAVVPEFRWYWREGDGAGKRKTQRGWAQAFGNRIDQLAKSGTLYIEQAPPARGGVRNGSPKQPNSGWKPNVEDIK